ncbi:calcium/sodium antiporter [Reichenbachiella sp. MALMAid0571]|uniref:calcium/sodium antiporter n=1 Tax=Reichenbachiella sp. MALMAid0571 TaxID=3143939 RepID=UPI0032DEC47D
MPDINNIYLWILILFLGLFVLVKAADYFNKAAEKIGLSFGMSPFIIGVLITAVGTSLPELITSAVAVAQGVSEIVPGNVAGSNITNIFLIIGIVAIVHQKPIHLFSEFIMVDLQFLIGSALFISLAFIDNKISSLEGILCLAGFGIYFHYLITSTKRTRLLRKEPEPGQRSTYKDYLQFLFSSILIYIAAHIVINAVVFTSDYYDVGTSIVAAGVLALGTSIPELVVSLDAVKKGKSDYALGNIMGSSIFNSFWVIGFSSLFGVIVVPDVIITLIMPVMLIATFLFYMLTRDKVITAWEGALFLLFYILFIFKLITV